MQLACTNTCVIFCWHYEYFGVYGLAPYYSDNLLFNFNSSHFFC